jgi:hypothetical protein
MEPLPPVTTTDIAHMVIRYDIYETVEALILGHRYRVRRVIGRQQ